MTDFETLIKEAMESGFSTEDLADKFTKALNAATAAKAIADERDEFYDKMIDLLDDGDSYESAAAEITSDAMDEYDEWDAEDCKAFYEIMLGINTYAAKLWNAVCTAEGEIDMYTKLLPVLGEIEGAINKRKKTDTPREPVKPVGSSGFKMADDEVIKDFLRSLR